VEKNTSFFKIHRGVNRESLHAAKKHELGTMKTMQKTELVLERLDILSSNRERLGRRKGHGVPFETLDSASSGHQGGKRSIKGELKSSASSPSQGGAEESNRATVENQKICTATFGRGDGGEREVSGNQGGTDIFRHPKNRCLWQTELNK